MKWTGINELREKFLSFFESKEHLSLKSFSLVPENDPSILLINAGMTPLKPYFIGKEKPPRDRITTCQKCIRTLDIENVGKTARHGTFFEMLGNFSFGDYFKKEAIHWAWEFFVSVLEMPSDRLWASVYEEDEEAYGIWANEIKVPKERIVKLGKKDNFWEHGTGPCGPCSEIYYDRGEKYGCGSPDCKPGCECDRYMEIWNLVFTQFNKEEDGSYTPLAKKNIDTGMGLERLGCVMQGVDSMFDVDTISNVIKAVTEKAGVKYQVTAKHDVSIRVIADHIRGSVMMISDGVLPSNEGRGYVLRRLIRRSIRHGKLLGIQDKFMCEIADVAIEQSKSAYPELEGKRQSILKVLGTEEERFAKTIDQGIVMLEEFMEKASKSGKRFVDGQTAFKLHDTYGFPIDLTKDIAGENGFTVDEEGFDKEMEKQKNMAREALKNSESHAWDVDVFDTVKDESPTEFLGYELEECQSKVLYISDGEELVRSAQEGQEVTVVLDRTVFYAESGGQTGDSGSLTNDFLNVEIQDCTKTPSGLYLHIGAVKAGTLEVGDLVTVRYDKAKRKDTARHHSATHLLHKALRTVLGEHVHQSGSLVSDERLRFDFTHFDPVNDTQIDKIHEMVNDAIFAGYAVNTQVMDLEEAKTTGAEALFDEKYGDKVRVVRMGDYSAELCGGTHVKNTSDIGLFKVVGETGIAAGVRRIEAVTGKHALSYYDKREKWLDEVSEVLKSTPEEAVKRAQGQLVKIKELTKEVETLTAKIAGASASEKLNNVREINGIPVLAVVMDSMDMNALRNAADTFKNKLGTGLVALGAEYKGKVNFVVTVTKNLLDKPIHCGKIIGQIAKIAGGGGGGRPDMAQAGGKDPSKLQEAIDAVYGIVQAL
ncbi:MAG TPA: alanine--tRNA ligase [Clostridiales bacterium]|nr:alanine--tRNA ligase [Clostridiales bacterium]